jgi:hypothetical protein
MKWEPYFRSIFNETMLNYFEFELYIKVLKKLLGNKILKGGELHELSMETLSIISNTINLINDTEVSYLIPDLISNIFFFLGEVRKESIKLEEYEVAANINNYIKELKIILELDDETRIG